MDEETLTCAFFYWTDNFEDEFPFHIQFESASEGQVNFEIKGYHVRLNVSECEFTILNPDPSVAGMPDLINNYLTDNACDIMTGEMKLVDILEFLVPKFNAEQPEESKVATEEEVVVPEAV